MIRREGHVTLPELCVAPADSDRFWHVITGGWRLGRRGVHSKDRE